MRKHKLTIIKEFSVFVVLMASSLLAAGAMAADTTGELPRSKRGANAAWSEDGLQKITVKELDVVYSRPGSSLKDYKKVLLKPISVAFRRDWGKSSTRGVGTRIKSSDVQRIKDNLAVILKEEIGKQLLEGGYVLVEQAGDDVLEVQMSIVDLYINAPDVVTRSGADVFAISAGEMTLISELRDSVSGETVIRIYDHAEARENAWPQRITNADNVSEARNAAAKWGGALRKSLDSVKGN